MSQWPPSREETNCKFLALIFFCLISLILVGITSYRVTKLEKRMGTQETYMNAYYCDCKNDRRPK